LVEVLEVQLPEEEVEVEKEVAQLAEPVVVVVAAWTMEQGCEELDRSDGEVEQPSEAMQLPVLPMNLEQVQLAEEVVEVEEEMVQLAELVVVVVADDYYK